MKLLSILGPAFLLAGCAAVATIPAAQSVLPASTGNADFRSATTVKLEQGNFIVVKTNLMGQSKGFALLGVVTLVPARFTRAMDRVYQSAGITIGRPQTLVNVITERSSSYWILFSIPKVSIRADMVEFIQATESAPPATRNEGAQRPKERSTD